MKVYVEKNNWILIQIWLRIKSLISDPDPNIQIISDLTGSKLTTPEVIGNKWDLCRSLVCNLPVPWPNIQHAGQQPAIWYLLSQVKWTNS
jgi:hypothetical protein